MTTVFGKIIRGELPCDKVFENERILAFKDIAPKAPVHLLIIPKKEIPSLQEVGQEDLPLVAEMLSIAQHLARQFSIADGYRILINNGRKGGQVVEHLHIHLIGGKLFSSDTDVQ
jgi:histidine triad (HIT) family protein